MSVFTINTRTVPMHTVGSLFKRALGSLEQALFTHRTHSLLAQLDDRMLTDIGLSRAEAGDLVDHPIWDAGLR